ncbi:hypothetical protein ES703_15829 [subsurface metagenome]
MELKEKLKEAIAKRQKIVDQVNAIADEIESLRQKRQALLQEALRYDGEVRTLEALIKEEEVKND